MVDDRGLSAVDTVERVPVRDRGHFPGWQRRLDAAVFADRMPARIRRTGYVLVSTHRHATANVERRSSCRWERSTGHEAGTSSAIIIHHPRLLRSTRVELESIWAGVAARSELERVRGHHPRPVIGSTGTKRHRLTDRKQVVVVVLGWFPYDRWLVRHWRNG